MLTADSPRTYGHNEFSEFPVAANTDIYEGAALTANAAGEAKPLGTSEEFLGFAEAQAKNNPGAAGARRVRVRRRGLIELPVIGAGATSIGAPVYATDDNTFTLTKSAGAVRIGTVAQHVSGTRVWVRFDAGATEAAITDPAGGATVDAEARTAINLIIDALEAAGITIPA